MPLFYFKILLRYRQVLIIPLPIIVLIVLMRCVLSVRDLTINTAIIFLLLMLFSIGDLFITLFDVSCDEFNKYMLFPINYYSLVLQKNIAVIFVSFVYTILISSTMIYMFHQPVYSFIIYITYCLTIIVPFISIGNILSSGIPKINSNNYIIMRMILNVFISFVLSIPFGVIMLFFNNIYIVLFYIAAVILVWRYISVSFAAKMLLRNSIKMIETI